MSIILGLIVASEATTLSIGIANVNGHYNYHYDTTICEIVSLERNDDINGSFFLGSGHVDSVEYYYFYRQTDKGLLLDKLKHSETYIVEDDSRTPCIHKIKDEHTWDSYYQIICPLNTVVKEFRI